MKQDDLKAARQLQQQVEKKRWMERKAKKDAVLHLRVEEDVMDRIKAEALARNMSVSDLVRCHLDERFSDTRTCDGIPEFLLATTAFSEVKIMRDSRCAVCDKTLPCGASAQLACGPPPPLRMVCDKCYGGIQLQFEEQLKILQGDR